MKFVGKPLRSTRQQLLCANPAVIISSLEIAVKAPRLFLLPAAMFLLLIAPLAQAVAQNVKPVAIVSIASVEKNLSDIEYLTRIVGEEATGKTAMLFGNALTAGMDKTRPSGLFVMPVGSEFHAVAFLPVTNLKLLLEVHREKVGEPKDVGNSILEIGTDQTAYVKEQNGWAFLAEKQEQLAVLPADPAALLGDLPTTYNVAGRILVQNIPAELKKFALDQIKAGFEQATQTPAAQADPNRAQMELMFKTYMQQIERAMAETEDITIGLVVNPEAKNVSLDVAITARDGTDMARRMAMQADLKSAFAGFLQPGAAFTMNYAAVLPENEIAQAKEMLKGQRAQIATQLAGSPVAQNMTPEQKAAMEKMVGQVYDLMEQAVGSGKSDGGAVVMLGPQSFTMAAGGFFPDGAALEKVLKDFADFLRANPAPNVPPPEITLNAGAIGDVKLHRGSMAIPEQAAALRPVFGEKFEFIVGTGKTSGYFVAGKDCEGLLKKIIDRSAAEAGKPVQPMQMTVSVLPILKFYQSLDAGNPLVIGLISSLEQEGGDKLVISSTASARAGTVRVEVQEGIIRVVGDGVKMFAAQFGGGLQ